MSSLGRLSSGRCSRLVVLVCCCCIGYRCWVRCWFVVFGGIGLCGYFFF